MIDTISILAARYTSKIFRPVSACQGGGGQDTVDGLNLACRRSIETFYTISSALQQRQVRMCRQFRLLLLCIDFQARPHSRCFLPRVGGGVCRGVPPSFTMHGVYTKKRNIFFFGMERHQDLSWSVLLLVSSDPGDGYDGVSVGWRTRHGLSPRLVAQCAKLHGRRPR